MSAQRQSRNSGLPMRLLDPVIRRHLDASALFAAPASAAVEGPMNLSFRLFAVCSVVDRFPDAERETPK